MTDQPNSLQGFVDKISDAIAAGHRRHERAELLAAYRLRHRWKASDASRLQTLNLSPVAARRAARLSGRGRPVVAAHTDAVTGLAIKILPLIVAFQAKATRKERLLAIKYLVWWPHYVETVYRGEYAIAKTNGLSRPAEATEENIADALCISSAVVRKLCTKVRQLRQEDPEAADFPPGTLAGFLEWIEGGRRDNFLPLN